MDFVGNLFTEVIDVVSKVQALSRLPETFAFGALPPEVNSARLMPITGGVSTADTAAAYATMADALNFASSASEAAMNRMAPGWDGPTSDRAQAAFRRHAAWQREQSIVARKCEASAAEVAAAYGAALGAMPKLFEILAVRALSSTLIATNTMNQNWPGIFACEAAYDIMWGEAAGVMFGYQADAFGALAALPTPVPPPPIVSGGGDSGINQKSGVPADKNPPPPWSETGPKDTNPPESGKGDGGNGNGKGDGGNGNGDGGSDPSDPTPDPGDTNPNPNPNPDPGQQLPEGEQAASDVNNALSSMTDSLGDSSVDGGSPDDHGFYGTSPYSSTLAGLNGGVGSVAALGMLRGGLGSMPGASTGFRMPANWAPGRGTPFGATPGNLTSGPAQQGPLRRGATAPKANMRRRRRDEERTKSKVFVPGEPEEVPVLEQPPVIGVIEYADGERQDEPIDEQTMLVGVIEKDDDDLVLAISERPR
ncbi:PPE family protein [Nocardia sp. NBC_01009]|uniref:PPE family protein n=1 Tax=Nocardia sp. NBC_01009 TaxID=2975996 RepID=UPI0038632895|nr:PPE family protein [Nocardia sp. NBC_01009]